MVAHKLSRREWILEKPQRSVLKLRALNYNYMCIEFSDKRAFGLPNLGSIAEVFR